MRRGKIIYDEQKIRVHSLDELPVISSKDLEVSDEINHKYINNKNLLIFDDSINSGDTIKRILDLVLKHDPKKITVAVITCRQNTLDSLKKDSNYSSAKFYIAENLTDDQFDFGYAGRIIDPYLEYICRPIENDHPTFLVKFSDRNLKNIIQLFEPHGEIVMDVGENFCFEDRTKISLNLNDGVIEDMVSSLISKYSRTKCSDLKRNDLWDRGIIIRIFLRMDVGEAILQPVIDYCKFCDVKESYNLRSDLLSTFLDRYIKVKYVNIRW